MSFKGAEPSNAKPAPKADASKVVDVVQNLSKIDDKAPNAELNKTTISDGNGGRIKLNDEDTKPEPQARSDNNGGYSVGNWPDKF
jgi:hypothetical protein